MDPDDNFPPEIALLIGLTLVFFALHFGLFDGAPEALKGGLTP